MRSIIVFGLVLGTLISTVAEASVEGCAQTLLQSPNDVLYSNLQVTPAQVQQIAWVRSSADQQRAQIEAQINQDGDPDQVAALTNVDATAETSVVNLLTPWQQSQCSDGDPMVVAPAPVVVTVPVPMYRRPIIVRPPRYPVAYPPVVRRPGFYPAPVVRRPVYAPAPAIRRPAYAPAPVSRRPGFAYHAPVMNRAPVMARATAPASHARYQSPSFGGHRR